MIKAAIVGCGNIAGFLDTPSDRRIVTHAHAYTEYPGVELVACCDPDAMQRERFRNVWGNTIRGYDSLKTLFQSESVELLSICSPTPFHADALESALQQPQLRTIICEKPFTQTQEEFDRLMPLIESSDKKILVNFMRRFDPGIRSVAKLIQSGTLGRLQHFSGTFTKGLYHNGSHMLELIEHLCGTLTRIDAISCCMAEDDLLGSFYLETEHSRGTLNNESGEAYALFELDVVLERGRIRIQESGHCITVETLKPSELYAGYYNLGRDAVLDDTMQRNLYNTVNYALHGDENVLKAHLELSRKLLQIKSGLASKKKLEWN